MRVDVWADIVCPFCWIGHRHLELATEQRGDPVQVVHHAFRLDPSQQSSMSAHAYLARKYGAASVPSMWKRVEEMGAAVGLDFEFSKAVSAPTMDAHRVILMTQAASGPASGMRVLDHLMRIHFTEGADVSDRDILVGSAKAVGLAADGVAAMLDSDDFREAVTQDEAAAHAMGVGGVPFFVMDGRIGVSGAQPPDVLAEAIRRAGSPAD